MKALSLALWMLASPARSEDLAEFSQPLYRGVESVADGVYGLLRGHLLSAFLPNRLSGKMSAVPCETSERIFAELLRRRQEKTWRRLIAERPAGSMGIQETVAWQRSAVNAHASAFADALVDALVFRYQLERFGQDSGTYASTFSNWDPKFSLSAGMLGGAYLYVAGLRGDFAIGPLQVDFDALSGASLQSALLNGNARKLVALTFARKHSPLAFTSEWGVKAGRIASERVGVNYATRF